MLRPASVALTPQGLAGPWARAYRQLFGLAHLERVRESIPQGLDPLRFVAAVLRELRVEVAIAPGAHRLVPRLGALAVVSNHPYGALDGLAALAAIGEHRTDVKVLANRDLVAVPEIDPLILPVVPDAGSRGVSSNAASMRAALKWLAAGHCVIAFPAGEVAHLDMHSRCITDPRWNPNIARLIQLSGAQVLPIHFSGANSGLFQLVGLFHPKARTMLLPRELSRRVGSRVQLTIGAPITADRIRAVENAESLTAHLRLRTYALAAEARANAGVELPVSPAPIVPQSIVPAADPLAITMEIRSLSPECQLLQQGDYRVYCAQAPQIPQALREIGRLRELTFRGAGEGTGRAIDLDAYDKTYDHLVLWHEANQQIVGSYRIGRIDELRKLDGTASLYTASLFKLREPLFQLLGPTLELGRSFVRSEYQRSFAPLLMLWKGIGEYIAREPRYVHLLGPVSISNEFSAASKQVMVEYLRRQHLDPVLCHFAAARQPVVRSRLAKDLSAEVAGLGHIDALAELVTNLEPDGKSVPILLKHYLRLGGRMLAFNVDPAFRNAIDCLLLVDLRRTDRRVLARYVPARLLTMLSARPIR